MGAGRAGRADIADVGLRLSARRLDWACLDRTALDCKRCGNDRDLVFLRQAIDLSLHLLKLSLEIVDIAGLLRRPFVFRGSLAGLVLPPSERCEHCESALEHFHLSPHLLLERGEGADSERLRHLLAE